MPRPIPIELYALIFRHITRRAALYNLCAVSRVFRHEAERLLYHTIRLPKDRGRLISWCHTIVENPRLAMQVYSLSLPIRFANGQSFTVVVDFNLILQELRHAMTRALSSLSGLVELEIYYESVGSDYLDPGIFCGHSFHLQVFEENLHSWYSTEAWLKFLSEQPGIRHWRSNISVGDAIDPDVLPLLTSAHFHSSALDILIRCPVIRALRVTRPGLGYFPRLFELEVFRNTLTNLSIEHSKRLIMELEMVRDAVPNIKFLALASEYEMLHPLSTDTYMLASILAELSGFPRLTTLVLELEPRIQSERARPTDPERTLSLATAIMNAIPTLRRVAFEMRSSSSWTKGRWPCYSRALAESGSDGDGITVFEAFDVLGPDSWRDVYN